MNKSVIATAVALLFSSHVFAESNTVTSDEVVVTASRVPQTRESVIADVTVINREEIERAGQSTFIELLQAQPGVEISSSGGAGTASSVYLRGTNASQVVVLVDGMRVGSATTGTTTFENIPLAQIDRIEILRGPGTSLYGQDAVGGVIQIFTRKGTGTPQFSTAAGYGNYNTRTAEAGFRGSVNDTSFALNASTINTDGFSAIRSRQSIDKDKDGYRNLAVSGYISHKIIEGHEVGAQILSSEGRANYDGGFNSFKNYVDLSQLSYSLFSKNQLTSIWHSTIRVGEGIDDQNNHFSADASAKFKTKQRQYSWQNDVKLPAGVVTLVYDRLEQRLESNSVYTSTSRNNDGFAASYLLNVGAHSFQTSYRADHNTQFGTNNTGGVGYGFSFNPNWRATASYGTAFKAPTFNDLYFPPDSLGNLQSDLNLKAEKSRNIEASLRYEARQSSASLTVYDNKIHNFITLDEVFFPINVDARIKGMTLAAAQRWDDWQLKGSADIQSPKNDDSDTLLARRANRHASLNLSHHWGDWRFGAETIASSMRYNDSANQFRLAGYAIFNLVADYKINKDWSLQGRLNNVLDKHYALASTASAFNPNNPIYNTPGSNLFVGVRYSPGN